MAYTNFYEHIFFKQILKSNNYEYKYNDNLKFTIMIWYLTFQRKHNLNNI